jgi:hypothetical protein
MCYVGSKLFTCHSCDQLLDKVAASCGLHFMEGADWLYYSFEEVDV